MVWHLDPKSIHLNGEILCLFIRLLSVFFALFAVNPAAVFRLNAVAKMAFEFELVPLRESVCRDARHDQFISCALAAQADAIVTRDNDLLSLGKPFGIPILTPRQLLGRIK